MDVQGTSRVWGCSFLKCSNTQFHSAFSSKLVLLFMQVRFLEVAFLGQKYAHLNFILPGDFQKCVSNLHIRQQCLRGMFSPHFCQSRLDPLFKISVSLIHENDLFISLVYISLTTTVLQHLFKCSVAICVPH